MRKLITAALVAATAIGGLAMTSETASARNGRNGAFVGGAAAGLVGGAIIGGALAPRRPYYGSEENYYQEGPRCHIERSRVRNEDGYGWHYQRVRVCVRSGY